MKNLPFIKTFLVLLPLLEIAGFIVVGGWIGILPTLLLILATTVLGLLVLRIQGFVTLMQVQRKLAAGEHPGMEMLNGALLMFGGLMLLIPGFITDIIGLLLLVPVIRVLLLKWLQHIGMIAVTKTHKRHGRVIEGKFHRENDKF